MSSFEQSYLEYHPCFSNNHNKLWARIHLPVAMSCNVKCIFCDHNKGTSCHTAKPGYASKLLTPTEALKRTINEMKHNSNLRIIAISGPGEPLFNKETFDFLLMTQKLKREIKLCLSTNGVLLAEKAEQLEWFGVNSISVSMSAINPNIAAKVYEWAIIDGTVLKGVDMGKHVISRQLKGIESAAQLGISVKINTILMPGINSGEIYDLSRGIAKAGAILQNIVPLVPSTNRLDLVAPSAEEIAIARQIGAQNIPQFVHCKQCRSDVVGIPGADTIL